jgi:hypothetical protein
MKDFLLFNDFLLYYKNRDNFLNGEEFLDLLKELIRDEHGQPYPLESNKSNEIFAIFNKTGVW